jgi:PAS domain S-box-containing protein
MAAFENISNCQGMESALQESEERFHLLFNLSNDGAMVHEIGVKGKPGAFIEVNDAACRMLGYSREELKTMNPADIDDPHPTDPSVTDQIMRDGCVVFERTHIAKDGHKIPVEISSRAIMLNGKQCVISMVRDITERKLAQERLMQLVAERSAQLNETSTKLVDETFHRRLLEKDLTQLRSLKNSESGRSAVRCNLSLDFPKRTVRYNSKDIVLTDTEAEILKCLMDKAGDVVTHAAIAEKLWGVGYSGAADIIKVHVRHLREKIESDPASPAVILTKFGTGYYFVEPV